AAQAVKELGVDAEVVKVTDINEIMNSGVMMTPALAVDGEVKVSGKVPSLDDVKSWLGGAS
ncbi:MAG: thioredoxin family protein, partial [Planctomycetota bacterium]